MTKYISTNPATGEELARFSEHSDRELEQKLEMAEAARVELAALGIEGRAKLIHKLGSLYQKRQRELGEIIAEEMGKPIAEAIWEADHCGDIYEYYAVEGPGFIADEHMEQPYGGGTGVIRTEPLGTLLGIMPWNFPYYQVARFAGPNLLVGNPIILKHSLICGRAATVIESLFQEAGFPEGAYQNIFATHAQVSNLIADSRIQGVSLTGSERAGRIVARQAGEAMKKVVLELGGSDAFIVLDDADVESAAQAAVNGRFSNGGQSCTSSKRIIVDDAVYDTFVEIFAKLVSKLTYGDPLDTACDIGPLSSSNARVEITEQVDDAVRTGAQVLVGGKATAGPGFFFEPTLLAAVPPEARIFREEVFGPVAVVYRVFGEEEAIAHANDADFGLGGVVFSQDVVRAKRIANRIETGMVWINSAPASAIDGPFGGVKRSGTGRELGRFGLDEFSSKKLIRVLEP